MGRFHRHSDGTEHTHNHDDDGHSHDDHANHLLPDHTDLSQGSGRSADGSMGNHGAYETGTERVIVLERILDENDRVAEQNRIDLAAQGVRTVNLMSSPGAGKTTLLAATIPCLTDVTVGILEGDIATSIDADALSGLGAQVALVNTNNGFGGECHLDAVMVRSGLDRLDLDAIDLLIIENVGNLVCPAEFDVGQDRRAMVYAITEGEDKPLKYPVMFRAAEVVVINKMDLLPHLDFDLDLFRSNLSKVNPTATVIELSASTGAGMERWLDWLRTA